jgi:predicted aminopeptidase
MLIAVYQDLIYYLFMQAKGQFKVVYNTIRIEKIMKDTAFPDSLKQKLKLVEEIRNYAFDSLGLKSSQNYTTYYDQRGKPILWIVTASEPFELKAYTWCFPIMGSFSYKGYFNYEDALAEQKRLEDKGYDTSVDEVSGWSTLGWFKDPVLSSMLTREPGSLANLIIHELTHATLYVKDNVDYNENLASFVGDQGAKKFLAYKYGKDSPHIIHYENSMRISEQYSSLVLYCADQLDILYKSFTPTISLEEKKTLKNRMMHIIKDTLSAYLAEVRKTFPKYNRDIENINNAYFIDFRRYRAQQNIFEEEFRNKFNSDFRSYMNYLKEKYPSL